MAKAAAVICSVLVAAGCGGSGGKQTAHYTTTPPTTCVGCLDLSPTRMEIRLARSSSPLFSIFPASPGERRCVIPAGGLAATHLRGWCRTSVRHIGTHDRGVVVSFTEAWVPESRCPPGDHCPAVVALHHTWSIVERDPWPGAPLRIVARRQSGNAPAPQLID